MIQGFGANQIFWILVGWLHISQSALTRIGPYRPQVGVVVAIVCFASLTMGVRSTVCIVTLGFLKRREDDRSQTC
jgi:hypothetical protein